MKTKILPLLIVSLLLTGCQPASTPTAVPTPSPAPSATIRAPVVATSPNVPTTSPPTAAPAPSPTAPPAALSPLAAGLEGLAADAFFDESYKRLLLRSPEYVTTLGLTQAWGSGNDRLTDLSDSYLRETQTLEWAILALLQRYDPGTLTPAQRLTAEVYAWYLDDQVRGHAFVYDNYPLNVTVFSVHNDLLQFFTDIHPVRSGQEARDYVTRLARVQGKYEQVIAGLKQRETSGVVLPGFLIPSVLSDLRAIATASPTSTPFYTAFAAKVTRCRR